MKTEKRILAARETERRRIARELHDGPAQSLAAILLQLDLLTTANLTDNPEQIREELLQLKGIARESLHEMRQILSDLKPVRGNISLLSVLEDFLNETRIRYGFCVEFKTRGVPQSYPDYMQTAVFRLVQEAVNNSRKHAGVSQAHATLSESEESLEFMFADQGCGFNIGKALVKADRFGIVGMQERVNLLGGTMEIKSKPGAGTQIWIVIPWEGRQD